MGLSQRNSSPLAVKDLSWKGNFGVSRRLKEVLSWDPLWSQKSAGGSAASTKPDVFPGIVLPRLLHPVVPRLRAPSPGSLPEPCPRSPVLPSLCAHPPVLCPVRPITRRHAGTEARDREGDMDQSLRRGGGMSLSINTEEPDVAASCTAVACCPWLLSGQHTGFFPENQRHHPV